MQSKQRLSVLSVFDGMSCGQIALKELGIKPDIYYASEIDKFAIKVTQANFPDTVQLGDVTKWREWDIPWGEIDLVTGGFPCQSFSVAGKQKGVKDPRGQLFWTMLEIFTHAKKHNPKIKFLIENVRMKKDFEEFITQHPLKNLGKVHKILINSSLVSAQNRNRFYWTNFPVTQPEDKKIYLKDILEKKVDQKYFLSDKLVNGFLNKTSVFGDRFIPLNKEEKVGTITARYAKMSATDPYLFLEIKDTNKPSRIGNLNKGGQGDRVYSTNAKSTTLSALGGGRGAKTGLYIVHRKLEEVSNQKTQRINKIVAKAQEKCGVLLGIRRLTPLECQRLQTVPEWYDMTMLSDTQRYKCLGNGWTIEVIKHILKDIKK